jgi:hypothetical protein
MNNGRGTIPTRGTAVLLLALALAWAGPSQAQVPAGPCPLRLFPSFTSCDRNGSLLCTAAFGLYRFDEQNRERYPGCEPRKQAGQAVFELLASRGVRDPNSPLAQSFAQAVQTIASGAADKTADFWVIGYNSTTAPATAKLQALLGLPGSRIALTDRSGSVPWDIADNATYWQDDAHLLELISLGNDYAMQPAQRWRTVELTLAPGEVRAVPVRLEHKAIEKKDAPRAAGIFPIALFRETALDHYSIDQSDILALGEADIVASPGYGETRAHW